MKVRISTSNTAKPSVYWKEADGFLRQRKRRSLRDAQAFARKVACRLEIEAYQRDLERFAHAESSNPPFKNNS